MTIRKNDSRSRKDRAEPQRQNRPSVEELRGRSESGVRSASAVEEGDPLSSVSARPARGAPGSAETNVDPEDLGRHFLKRAVQDENPIEPDEDEETDISPSELLETTDDDADERPTPVERGLRPDEKLLTYLSDGTDREREISERAEAEIRRRRRREGKR